MPSGGDLRPGGPQRGGWRRLEAGLAAGDRVGVVALIASSDTARPGVERLEGAIVVAEVVLVPGAAVVAVLAGGVRKRSSGAWWLGGRPRCSGRRCHIGVGGNGRRASGPFTIAADAGWSDTSASRRYRLQRRR